MEETPTTPTSIKKKKVLDMLQNEMPYPPASPAGRTRTLKQEQQRKSLMVASKKHASKNNGSIGAFVIDGTASVYSNMHNGVEALEEELERQDYATWGDVCKACWTHSPLQWLLIILSLFGMVLTLYFVAVGLELMTRGAIIMTACANGQWLYGTILDVTANPVNVLMAGVLVTVLTQALFPTIAIVVALVNAEMLSVRFGIYMLMGANCGNCITNTLVALAYIPKRGSNSSGEQPSGISAYLNPAPSILPLEQQGTLQEPPMLPQDDQQQRHNELNHSSHSNNKNNNNKSIIENASVQYGRAIAAASLQDMFQLLTTAILFPLEVATGYLTKLSGVLVSGADTTKNPDSIHNHRATHFGPIYHLVKPLTDLVIIPNKQMLLSIGTNNNHQMCQDYYPLDCTTESSSTTMTMTTTDSAVSNNDNDNIFETSDVTVCKNIGLITCKKFLRDGDNNNNMYDDIDIDQKENNHHYLLPPFMIANVDDDCPAFFQANATLHDDQLAGFVVFLFGWCIILIFLALFVTIVCKILHGLSTRIIYKATNWNGYLAMAFSACVTTMLGGGNGSTFTNSALITPLVGIGLIRIDQAYPFTLGAHLGTSIMALIVAAHGGFGSATTTSLMANHQEQRALQLTVANLFFIISGLAIWYPIPIIRTIPIRMAKQLGLWSIQIWRGIPIVYILSVYLIVPMLLMMLSTMFGSNNVVMTSIASCITALLVAIIIKFIYWWIWQDGDLIFSEYLQDCSRRENSRKSLIKDMAYVNQTIRALTIHTKLPEEHHDKDNHDEEEEEDDDDDEEVAEKGTAQGNKKQKKKKSTKKSSSVRRLPSATNNGKQEQSRRNKNWWSLSWPFCQSKRARALYTLPDDMEFIITSLTNMIVIKRLPMKEIGEGSRLASTIESNGSNNSDDDNNHQTSPSMQIDTAPTTTFIRNIWIEMPWLYKVTTLTFIPLALIGIIIMYAHHSKPYRALATLSTIVLLAYLVRYTYKWFFLNSPADRYRYWKGQRELNDAIKSLPNDMEQIRMKVDRLSKHCGLASFAV